LESGDGLRSQSNRRLFVRQKAKTQKLAAPRTVYCAFVPIHLQLQLSLYKANHRFHDTFPCAFACNKDVTIIRIASKSKSSLSQFFVQVVQQDVCQEWTQRPALRRSFLSALTYSVDHNSGAEVGSNQFQDSLVLYLPCHSRHEHVMVHPVEELFQVQVHNPSVSFLDIALGLKNCVMRSL